MVKQCSKCKKIKEITEFTKRKISKDGFYGVCKKCRNIDNKIWRKNNPKRVKEIYKKYYNNNSKKILKKIRKYNISNAEKLKITRKKWYLNNLNYRKKYNKIWIKNNPERVKENHNNWIKNNPEKIKEINKKWKNNNRLKINKYIFYRTKTDIKFRLRHQISSIIFYRLKKRLINKNKKSTFSFLPYTVDDLKRHLEFQFEPWMNWNNWSNKAGCWTIDHIKPDSSFNYKSVEDKKFQECWALKNLRPLEYVENVKKSDKIIN